MREGQLGDTGRVVVTDDERQKENIDQRPFPRDGDGPCGRPHAAGSQGSDFRFFFSLSEFRSSEAQASFLLGGVFGSVARFVLKKSRMYEVLNKICLQKIFMNVYNFL